MALDDLYREVILDHYRNPRNRAEIDAYLKSKSDKKRVKAKAREWIAARGGNVCDGGVGGR